MYLQQKTIKNKINKEKTTRTSILIENISFSFTISKAIQYFLFFQWF